jgi:nucleoid-associated protein YgaU
MSKNLMVSLIVILLIVGGFGIYTYDQSNQAKKEVEEKNLKLVSNDELISELQENIQEKEKQIDELKSNLAKGEEGLEKEYADKLTELTEEKAKLEVLLAEKERIWLDKEKEKQQLIIKLEEEVKGYKENINELENEIVNLKEEAAKLAKGEKDLVKEYADKLTELTEEKARLEALLAEKEETIKTIMRQKEESDQIVFSKDKLISELQENIQEKEKQIGELKAGLTEEEKDLEKEYATKISELMKEKGQLEALLIEQEGILQTKDREKEELISKLEDCNNQINELKDKLVQQDIEEEKDYVAELSVLTEEKSKLENQLKIYQDLLSEKEDTILLIKQKNEESEKNIVEKDKTMAELSESIRGYENQIKEISEQAAKEKEIEKEKETEYSNKLSLLTEEKSKLETQLKASQELLSEKDSIITALKQKNEESEKNIVEKDKAMVELSESVKGYEDLVKEIQEQMAQEGKEKEAEYADRLALLKEGKDIIEAKLTEAIKKSIPDYYEVEKGDSLWKIAERFYNTGEKWIRIFEENSDIIKNPSMIYPYQRFIIPKE